MNLTDRRPIFIGYKMDGSLKRRFESLSVPDRAYVATDGSAFLRICRLGEDQYVGKVVSDRLTTDRVDDVRRNVLSILQRLSPDTRFPKHLDILPCDSEGSNGDIELAPPPATQDEPGEDLD